MVHNIKRRGQTAFEVERGSSKEGLRFCSTGRGRDNIIKVRHEGGIFELLPKTHYKEHHHNNPICAAALSWMLCSTSTWAQQVGLSNDPSTAASSQPQSAIIVVGKKLDHTSTIDAKSYNITGDLQNGSGSLADVLRHVPSVQVDSEGAVTLRGDPNVTILVDGKPSALFSGPGRAQALESLSPDQFARVEVQTNPSAGQTAEGSGGVINLISNSVAKGRGSPTSGGTIKANVGSGDRFDLGGSGSYSDNGLSLSAGMNFRRSAYDREIETQYSPLDQTLELVPAKQIQTKDTRNDILSSNGTAGYDFDQHDHAEASLSVLSVRQAQSQSNTYQTGSEGDPLALDFNSPGFVRGHFTSVTEDFGLTHTFSDDGHSLSGQLSLSQSRLTNQTEATYSYQAPAQPDLYQNLLQTATFPALDLKLDYKTPLPNKAILVLGYEFKIDWQNEKNQALQGPSARFASADPAFAQRFNFVQQVNAAYANYEQTFGNLTLQPGVRLEITTLDTELVSSSQTERQYYFDAYPSFHVSYQLDNNSEIKGSYGRRVIRPDELQLDPFRIYNSQTLYTSGNQNLRPAFTQSYELGYEFSKKATAFQATLFYRQNSNQLTTVTQEIGNNVLLSTWENLGSGGDVGLDFVVKRDLLRTLSISASTDIRHSEVDAEKIDIFGKRSADVISGQITLNWKVTPQDFMQIGGEASGKQLTAQGYKGGTFSSDLGWRHKFDERLGSLVTVTDPFGLARRTTVIETPFLIDVEKRQFKSTAVFVGFTYAFGGASNKSSDQISFDRQNREEQ